MKAMWNGATLAESDDTVVVEGNHYFPKDSVQWELFEATKTTSMCPWKGKASYYTVSVAGKDSRDKAWAYLDPKDAAANIKDHVAFWRDVEIVE